MGRPRKPCTRQECVEQRERLTIIDRVTPHLDQSIKDEITKLRAELEYVRRAWKDAIKERS